jgi:hypothetical protein
VFSSCFAIPDQVGSGLVWRLNPEYFDFEQRENGKYNSLSENQLKILKTSRGF